jgi:hypothetical protein
LKRTLIICVVVILLAGCSAAAVTRSEATPTARTVAMATAAQTVTPEPTPTPSASFPALVTPAPTPALTPDPMSKPAPSGCPILPVTIDEIARLTPKSALACFGGAALTFEAYVPPQPYGIGDARDYSLSPAWLDGLGGSVVALSAGPDAGILVLANVPPVLGRCDSGKSIPECPFSIFEGRRVWVSAHFDDPVAQTCRANGTVEGGKFTDAEAVAECRRLLIVLSIDTDVPSASAADRG